MLYNEEEVLKICKKYGIETVVTDGYPIFEGKEINEDFSIATIMNEPILVEQNEILYKKAPPF